jgi:hypothetical protein
LAFRANVYQRRENTPSSIALYITGFSERFSKNMWGFRNTICSVSLAAVRGNNNSFRREEWSAGS